MSKYKYSKVGRLRYMMFCALSGLLVALMTAVPGCAEEKPPPLAEPAIPAHFTTYTDEANLFSISYPPDWELALSLIEGLEQATKEIIKSIETDVPLERSSAIFFVGVPTEEGYAPNVNIGVESLPGGGWTLDEAVEASIRGIKQVVEEYHEFSRVKTTVGGREAVIIDSEVDFPGLGRLRALQMCVLVGKVAWFVTCTPPAGEFSQWEDDFHDIVRSLRILK